MVPLTAIPYAAASRLDFWKYRTSAMHATASPS